MADTTPRPEELVRLLLNDSRLVGYFHFDLRPEPLPVANDSGVAVDLASVTADGHAVVPSPSDSEAALLIETVTMGDDAAQIDFRYRTEGISGTAHFAASDAGWNIKEFRLVEN